MDVMSACELCVYGTGKHREDCEMVKKWQAILAPLAQLDSTPQCLERSAEAWRPSSK